MTADERSRAATYLRKELSPKIIRQLRWAIHHDPYFDIDQQFGVGRIVRKIFHRGGFGWAKSEYDNEWFNLLRDAVQEE